MSYVIAGVIGAAALAVLVLAWEGFRTRKPRLHRPCGQSFSAQVALECTLAHGHLGVHGCKRGKTNVWWEDET